MSYPPLYTLRGTVLYDGNSIFAARTGVPNPAPIYSRAAMGVAPSLGAPNIAVSGVTTADRIAGFEAAATPLLTPYLVNALVYIGNCNDVLVDNLPPQDWLDATVQYFRRARSVGYNLLDLNTLVAPLPLTQDGAPSDYEERRQKFCASAERLVGKEWGSLVRFHLDPVMGLAGCELNNAYYLHETSPDRYVHPCDAGAVYFGTTIGKDLLLRLSNYVA